MMKKDERIIRPELLTNSQIDELEKGIARYTTKMEKREREKDAKRRALKAQLLAEGKLEERNGKIFVKDMNAIHLLNNI